MGVDAREGAPFFKGEDKKGCRPRDEEETKIDMIHRRDK